MSAGAALAGSIASNSGNSWWNNAFGTALNFGASTMLNYKQYSYNKNLMKLQSKLNYDYGRKTALNQYNWQRQGLESANYNPMLAVQNPSGVNTSFSGLNSAPDMTNSADLINNSIALRQQRVNEAVASSQVENQNADTQLKQNQSVTESARYWNVIADNYLKEAQTAFTRTQNFNYPHYIRSEIYKNLKQAELFSNQVKYNNAYLTLQQQKNAIDAENARANTTNAETQRRDMLNRYDLGKNTKTIKRGMSIFGIGGDWSDSGYYPNY